MDQDETKMDDGVQSPATPDSRKRPLDIDNEDAIAKRSHYIPGTNIKLSHTLNTCTLRVDKFVFPAKAILAEDTVYTATNNNKNDRVSAYLRWR